MPYAVRALVDRRWPSEFESRVRSFEERHPGKGSAVSLKVRVTSGCYHREHSPHAYALIDEHLALAQSDSGSYEFVEHESGPEILMVVSAGLGLAASVINLVVAVLHARQRGVEKGDRPADPVELIVRRLDTGEEVHEETVLRIGHREPAEPDAIKALFQAGLDRLAEEDAKQDH